MTNLPDNVFLRNGCILLAAVLVVCCWSRSGVSMARRRRGDVGVGGAPLAMLLRLDVELLRLPGPAFACFVAFSMLSISDFTDKRLS